MIQSDKPYKGTQSMPENDQNTEADAAAPGAETNNDTLSETATLEPAAPAAESVTEFVPPVLDETAVLTDGGLSGPVGPAAEAGPDNTSDAGGSFDEEHVGADQTSEAGLLGPSHDRMATAEPASTAQPIEPSRDDAPTEDQAPPAPDLADEMAALRRQLEQIDRQMTLDRKALRQKDETIAQLYQELQDARGGLAEKLLMPVFGEIVRVVDQLSHRARLVERSRQSGESDVDVLTVIREYREMLVVALENSGLSQISATELDDLLAGRYAPREMKIVATIDTGDQDLDRRVSRVVDPGYYYDNKLAFPTKVDVYRFKQEATEANDGD